MRLIFLVLVSISFLFAHKLNIFLFEENEQIIVNSYFASGSPCKECKVEIFDENNNIIELSKTNAEGNYTVKNITSKMYVKVEAVGGHASSSFIEPKKIDSTVKDKEETNNLLNSLIAIILIAIIFLGLKRFRRE